MNWKRPVTQSRLRELIKYCPDTGDFTWVVNRKGPAKMGDRAGTVCPLGYTVICLDGIRYMSHRLAFMYVTGQFPRDEIDHIDGNPRNNSWINLREATRATNCQNTRVSKNNKLGIKGICLHHTGKYRAYTSIGAKSVHIGLYETVEEAKLARDKVVSELHGDYFCDGKRENTE